MVTHKQYLKAYAIVKAYKEQLLEKIKDMNLEVDMNTAIEDLDMTASLYNSIRYMFKNRSNIMIKDIPMSKTELRQKGMGTRNIQELQKILIENGIILLP